MMVLGIRQTLCNQFRQQDTAERPHTEIINTMDPQLSFPGPGACQDSTKLNSSICARTSENTAKSKAPLADLIALKCLPFLLYKDFASRTSFRVNRTQTW